MSKQENTVLTNKPAGRFISLQTKLIVGFTLIFTVVFASTYYWFYNFARTEAMNQIKQGLYDTINGATATGVLGEGDRVQTISGDAMEGLIKDGAIRESDGLTDDPRYWEQIKILCDIRRIEPRAYPYTYIIGEKKNELIFITSWGWCLEGATSNDYATFKQPIEFSRIDANVAAMTETVFQTKSGYCSPVDPSCIPDIYSDPYGSWVSAYAPIKNSSGETVAGLGVDFTASYVNQVQQDVLRKIYIAFAITYVILLSLVYFVAQILTRPMIGLTRAAGQIGEGNYEDGLQSLGELTHSARFPDETETMDRVFRSMVDKVYKREQILRQQVHELKIEIDQAKRQKQVGEIVESEFFQELRTKARKMREQQSEGKDSADSKKDK